MADSNRWGVVLCTLLSASTVLANIEQVRRITYVLHPGPPGIYHQHPAPMSRSSAVVSSTQERSRRMSRVGSSPTLVQRQQPLTSGKAAVSTQSRQYSFSRSSGQQDAPRSPGLQHRLHMQGVNICGGKCCHGWSKSAGSERCTKPNCSPPCQNGGMCLRPHLCVCKPGTKGKVCEERATQDTSTGAQSHGAGAPAPPQRPIPQQAAPQSVPKKVQASPESSQGQVTLALKQKPQAIVSQPQMVPPQTLTMNLQHGQTQQFMIKPKYFSNSKRVLQGEQSTEGSLPLRANGLDHLTSQLHYLGNQTGRIKVVFTPSICKVTCTKGRCHNNCEKGNTTTLISENGHAADTLTSSNFRVESTQLRTLCSGPGWYCRLNPIKVNGNQPVVTTWATAKCTELSASYSKTARVICHLPCMNGGQCTARDKCQCPPNFTGKLCHIPVQNGNGQKQYQQNSIKASGSHVIHSTHTLPLTVTGQQGIKINYPPNMVNIHVKHPPEASVQFHQVSRVESSSSTQKKDSHVSYHGVQKHQLPHAVYPHQQTVSHVYPVSAKTQLGRCFQETTNTQCGKPLPGLSKQEDCCGTVGTSWGLGKCMKCPKKTTYSSNSHYMECPQGYKRINATFCQDINECYMQGVCPNGECLNTIGSFRCTCKQGFVPDPTYSSCVVENLLISEEKGACYRLVSTGKQCMLPLSVHLTRQLCCCSVGKAWGPNCETCPVLGTPAFKQICPGGMGYTVPVLRGPRPPKTYTVQPPIRTTLQPIITREEPIEALSVSQGNDAELNGKDDATRATDRNFDDRGQLQVSPGISTVKLDPQYPEVVEKSSPPVPVEIAPDVAKSSESQVIAPTQVTEVNECIVDPDICGEGFCVNLPVGYLCVCHEGYKRNENQTKCIDINECAEDRNLCPNGRCDNTDGSYLCICSAGYMANGRGTDCVDVNECLRPDACPDGLCINAVGSFHCRYCDPGFRMNRRGQCEDIDECLAPITCPYDRCVNNPGSFACVTCPDGYRGSNGRCYDVDECQEDTLLCANGDCSNLEGSYMCTCRAGFESTSDSKQCIDIDECQLGNLCLNGKCQNIEGSFLCSCNQGYQLSPARDRCDDIDECQDTSLCGHGQCRNTRGSFTCICNDGYKLSAAGDQCEDIDECQERDEACQGGGSCYNTDGSYTCVCPDGFLLIGGRRCQDVNECENPELCSSNGECLNTAGSFHCICDQGFTTTPDGRLCEDVDECTNSTLCSQGFCENTNGSYRCLCYQGYQDSLDGQGCVDVNECAMLSGVCGEAKCENVDGSFLCLCSDDNQEYDPMTGHCKYRNMPDHYDEEVKQCYYNLNNVNFCENVLTVNVSKQECCCTLGAAWGDTCEMFPCPVLGSDEYAVLCPEGKGYVPSKESLYEGNGLTYQDADECMLFGSEICKNGFCLNTEASFECYCKQGTYYDPVKLQCFDNNECDDPSSCIDGECINTDGSYSCFCTRPMVLDATGKRCIRPQDLVEPTEETDVYQDLCWENLSEDYVCSRPLLGKQTTYTECCCLYGVAWGMQCALCPMEGSEDHALLCNLRQPGFRQPYGEDALEFRDYSIHPDPYSLQEREESDKYEELQAEECGILNGCENGRCVRVQEGYTCDCFDGYHLDIMKMTCVDVNECNELNSRMSLCKNAKCINTEGSYKCVCLPGYRPSDKPNYCTAINSERDDSELE